MMIEVVKPKGGKQKWGPILVEQKPSRHQRDGRTVLERDRERKKRNNLEGGQGNAKTYNTFSVLTNSEIVDIASIIDVSTVKDRLEKQESIVNLQKDNVGRAQNFSVSCRSCKVANQESETGVPETNDPCIPVAGNFSRTGDDDESHG
jgi:hypothetical protein